MVQVLNTKFWQISHIKMNETNLFYILSISVIYISVGSDNFRVKPVQERDGDVE